MFYMQVLNRCIKAISVFRTSPYSWGVHKHLSRAILPYLGFPLECFFPKVHFFGLLAGSPILGSQPPLKHPRCNLKPVSLLTWNNGDGRKRRTTPHWQVAILMTHRTYLQGLIWTATPWIVFHTHLPNLKVFIEGLTSVQLNTWSRESQHISISRVYPQISFWEQGRQVECTFQG